MRYYKVTFFDKNEIELDESQAEALKNAMRKNVKSVEIGTGIYAVSSIARMEYSRQDNDNRRLLSQDFKKALSEPQPKVSRETIARMKKLLSDKLGWYRD